MKVTNVSKGEKVKLFTSIAIETSAQCNRHCYFCPNDYFKRPDKYMSDEMIDSILDQLGSMSYAGRIEFYIYNEPTRDKRLLQIIMRARKRVPKACLMFSTNGDYMKGPADIKAFMNAGLNQMLINIYSANDGSDKELVFQNGVKQAQKRYDLFHTWRSQTNFNDSLPLYHYISPGSKTVHIQKKFGVRKGVDLKDLDTDFDNLSNRSGLVEDFKPGVSDPLHKMCTKPFRFLNINWQGDGIICCNDYEGRYPIGNVKRDTLEEIWNSELMNLYRLRLQNKNRCMALCNVCDFNGGYYTHMINKVTFGGEKDLQLLKKDML